MIEDTLEIGNQSDNKEIVKKYLDKWYTYRDSKMLEQEYALSTLFQHFYQNNNLQNVLVKVSCLNDFYSTNIRDTYSVAKVIYQLNIDRRLQNGDLTLVDDIVSAIEKNCKSGRREYSFASKYCSFHCPDVYPIFDSRNEEILNLYKNEININPLNLRESYEDYVRIINKYREIFGLECFSYKEIDRFNWLFCNLKNEETK